MTYYRYCRRRSSTPLAAGAAVVVVAAMVAGSHGHHGRNGTLSEDSMSALPAAAGLPGGFTPARWARSFIHDAGLPQTSCERRFVVAWEDTEATFARFRNPLDTTLTEPGSYRINDLGNSIGVQAYPSFAEGLHATVVTLYNGRYQAVITAMRALGTGNDAQAAADAVAGSSWGTQNFEVNC